MWLCREDEQKDKETKEKFKKKKPLKTTSPDSQYITFCHLPMFTTLGSYSSKGNMEPVQLEAI